MLACTLLTLSAFLSAPITPQQSRSASTSQAEVLPIYSDTSDGLRQLLQDMRTAAKNRDNAKLSALIRETEIPNHETWSTATFGQEKGESWAGRYGKNLSHNEKQLQDFIMEVALEDGEISAQKQDAAMVYDTLTVPLDLYLADWRQSNGPNNQKPDHIGYFMFVDGKFRWDSTVEFFRVQKSNRGGLLPAKLIKRVAPKYPAEARDKRIQGTVKLNVIILKDGSVTVQNVVEGDQILVPAAIEAVRQWRYRPFILTGQPVDVQSTIDVVFVLND
jgi:TonB family protein